MVSDNGKRNCNSPKWIVRSVEGKNPKKPNKWHPKLIGKRCDIEILEPQRTGFLWIEGLVEWEEYSAYYTTPVLSIVGDNDVLTVETENSVYTFVRIEEERNENV